MPEPLRHDAFAARVGEAFTVMADAQALALELVEVRAIGAATSGRQPFSLLFRGPQAPRLTQRTHPLRHPELGALEVFLVPVGPDAVEGPDGRGMCYEGVFN